MDEIETSWSRVIRLVSQDTVDMKKDHGYKTLMDLDGNIQEFDMQGAWDRWCIDANTIIENTDLPEQGLFVLAYKRNQMDRLINILEDIMLEDSYKVQASKGCPTPDLGEDLITKDVVLTLSRKEEMV